MSFRTMNYSRQMKVVEAVKNAAESQTKTEGTSVTYGQAVTMADSSTSETVSIEESFPARNVPLTSEDNIAIKSSRRDVGPIQIPFVTPEPITVKVVQDVGELEDAIDEAGNIVGLNCKVKTNISLAAFSSNNAVVVQPKKRFHVQSILEASTPRTLQNIFKANFNIVSPNVESYAIVQGSSVKNSEEIREALIEAQKTDLSISLKSKRSESVGVNLLKVPTLAASLVYNFFTEEESDIEIQEDQSRDPLSNSNLRPHHVPRYVKLNWNVINVTEPITGTEQIARRNKRLRSDVFCKRRGVDGSNSSNFRNSVKKSRKGYNPVKSDGLDQEVVDIHNPEKGFNSLANAKAFPNNVSTVVNTAEQRGVINNIPYSDVRKSR